ncbi:MAG: tRNA threonylcarbamoyladenosine dehydratase [Ruminococcus sp.]|nr:tRNA threonylcarbamoyladenosine dehydratase [Ruminococcus sp.]
MSEIFARTELMFGSEAMNKLKNSRVAVFGIGGVGGYTAEALVRSGIGAVDLIDNDKVNESNINRQIIALHSTLGMYKADAMKLRVADINPECRVTVHKLFFMPDTSEQIDFSVYDYVVDAIDTVTGKIEIIMRAKAVNVPVISSMGAGNKLDPAKFEISDIYKTSVCPLARVMRRELKGRGVESLKVLYSTEQAFRPQNKNEGKPIPASNSFVPSVAGLIIAGEVIKDLIL